MQTELVRVVPVAIGLKSAIRDVETALHQQGVFHYSHEYVKDWHFERHVLAPKLKTVDEIHQFLRHLDDDNTSASWGKGCTKAHVARSSLAYEQSVVTPLEWALRSLARARRTCCSCHETGSFHTRQL